MNEHFRIFVASIFVFFTMAACSPDVGSKAWCKMMEDKPKGDWTANEAADYAKHCIFNGE